MPKQKTRKAFKKRFRITKKGKVLGSRSMRRHLMGDRSPKKKRQSRLRILLNRTESRDVKTALPYS